jgi:cytochrome c oxidase subunit 2
MNLMLRGDAFNRLVRSRFASVACLVLAGCSGNQSPLNPAGEQADRLFSLLNVMTWICGFFYLLVMLFLGWALWRARGRFASSGGPVDPVAEQRLSRGLLLWAVAIVAGLIVLVIGSFLADRGLAEARDRGALQVRITAHQYWWRIEYRDPAQGGWVETANELHLPLGATTRISLRSADVIHSFWVPNIAGKMDVIPGRINVVDVTPRRVGWFRGQCAEFCGLQHTRMALDVSVESPAAFRVWLARQRGPADAPENAVAARGLAIATSARCAYCHSVRGTTASGAVGPDLTHLASRRSIAAGTMPMSRAAVQGWIAQPQALKPGTMMPAVPLEPADADALSLYLAGLK